LKNVAGTIETAQQEQEQKGEQASTPWLWF